MDKKGVAVVTGYTKDVDWIESAAFEMMHLALWQEYKDVGSLFRRLQSSYEQLANLLGFVSYVQ